MKKMNQQDDGKKRIKKSKIKWILLILGIFAVLCFFFTFKKPSTQLKEKTSKILVKEIFDEPQSQLILKKPTERKTLKNDYHIFQTFNNCGPASFSMALSYYGIKVDQKVLGNYLRPYQVPNGNNDDKSVTLNELAEKAKDYNLNSYHRPAGDIEKIKLFITYDMPIITRTWLKTNDDIGHYRVIKGYDDKKKIIIQDDSLQGKNLEYSYEEFFELWGKYNYEYLVLASADQVPIVESILEEEIDKKVAWEKAVALSKKQLEKDNNNVYARFNLSVAYYNLKKYEESVIEFEKVENKISSRTLWYQIEPILAYYYLEDYGKVFNITNKILNDNNRAFSELYIIKAKIYEKQNKPLAAEKEYEKAFLYNKNINLKDPIILK